MLRHWVLLSALALALMSCTSSQSTKISTDYEVSAIDVMRAYRTYDWLPELAPDGAGTRQPVSDMDERRLVQAIADELDQRGYVHVEDGTADFLVGYFTGTQRKMTQSGNTRWGVGVGSGGTSVGVSTGGGGGGTYDEGTFIIDIVNAASDELVWRGTSQGAMRAAATPEEREKQLRSIVNAILRKFPPETKR